MSRLVRFENILLVPVFAALLCTSGFAADKKAASGKDVTVTGCLAKGDEANEYSLKTEDGKTYGLMSSSVKLDAHVGHKVTVTGKPVRSKEKHEAGKPEESEHLNVSKLDMVSATCP
jgi:hypothetical protein